MLSTSRTLPICSLKISFDILSKMYYSHSFLKPLILINVYNLIARNNQAAYEFLKKITLKNKQMLQFQQIISIFIWEEKLKGRGKLWQWIMDICIGMTQSTIKRDFLESIINNMKKNLGCSQYILQNLEKTVVIKKGQKVQFFKEILTSFFINSGM